MLGSKRSKASFPSHECISCCPVIIPSFSGGDALQYFVPSHCRHSGLTAVGREGWASAGSALLPAHQLLQQRGIDPGHALLPSHQFLHLAHANPLLLHDCMECASYVYCTALHCTA